MSGTEYRCIVSQTNMKTEKSSVVYSNTVKLTVDKASSTTELGTSRTGGNATHETTVETKKTVTAEYKQGNATYQKYKNAYTEDDKITGDVFGGSDSTGYHYYTGLTAGAESNANGVYTVSGTAVPLTAATDRITLDGKAYEISDKGFKRTPKAEEINGTTYTVYTATGVAGESGKTETLTLYRNLSNTLTIENLNENTTVAVAFETPLTLYSIPQSDKGYTVSDVKKTPNDYGNENQIRARGTVTFTVAPVSGPYLTALTVNGKNCLATISNDGNENKLTVVNNRNGSYTITVANVTKNIELTAASMKFRTEKTELSVPKELKEQYADTDARCKLVALTAEGDMVSMTLSELKALISA